MSVKQRRALVVVQFGFPASLVHFTNKTDSVAASNSVSKSVSNSV
jgi:hypothetical protein